MTAHFAPVLVHEAESPTPVEQLCSNQERLLAIVERSIELLERLGGPSDQECQSLRQLIAPALAPALTAVPQPEDSALKFEPVVERISLDKLLDSMGDLDLRSDPPAKAMPAPRRATKTAADATANATDELPQYPRVATAWRHLFGNEPDHGRRIRCGRYLAKAHWQEFGRHARSKVTCQDGTTSKQKLYKREWMLAKIREFAAQPVEAAIHG